MYDEMKALGTGKKNVELLEGFEVLQVENGIGLICVLQAECRVLMCITQRSGNTCCILEPF